MSITNKGVSSVYHNGRLYVLHVGNDGALNMGSLDYDGNNFDSWTKAVGTNTDSAPALASFNGRLYQGHKGSNNQVWLRYSTNNRGSWTNWFQPNGALTSTGFSMTVHNNQLCILHKANAPSRNVYLGCSSDGVNWGTWKQLAGVQTDEAPTISSAFGYLWEAHRGSNNELWLRKCWNNGDSCDGWIQLWGAWTTKPIAISAYNNNQICVMHTGLDSFLYQSCSMNYGNNWHPWRRFYGQSNLAPSLANITDRLAEIHVGLNNKIYKRVLGASSGKRGYYSEMKWNNPLGGFGVNSTYENKISLANGTPVSKTTYLTKDTSAWPNCIPSTAYWASNLPYSYLDTRVEEGVNGNGGVCDNTNNIVTYTIGSSNPILINPGATYFNYMLTSKGTRDNPIYEIRSQKGEMRPDWCYNGTACSYINNGQRFNCNSNNGDVWCSWMVNCIGLCGGYNIDSVDNSKLYTRDSTAPYWYKEYYR